MGALNRLQLADWSIQSSASTGFVSVTYIPLSVITIFHLATQPAGFEKTGGFGKLLFKSGTKWSYSEAGPNWLADILTVRYKKDLKSLMFERVFT